MSKRGLQKLPEPVCPQGGFRRVSLHSIGSLLGEQRQNIARLAYAEGASWDISRTRVPGTCERIISDALDFLSAPHPSARILLLTGVAGCGKSAIAHTVAQNCHEREKNLVLLTSFFFSSGAVGRSNPEMLFSTVARDLTSQHPSLKSAINNVIALKPAVVNMSISNQFAELILGPAVSCAHHLPGCLVIVIDAFDEGFSRDLLRIIEDEIPKLPPNFRFLITSRDDRFTTVCIKVGDCSLGPNKPAPSP